MDIVKILYLRGMAFLYRGKRPEEICIERGLSISYSNKEKFGYIIEKNVTIPATIPTLLREWTIYHEIGHDILARDCESPTSSPQAECLFEHFALVLTVALYSKNTELIKSLTFFNFKNPGERWYDFPTRTSALKERVEEATKELNLSQSDLKLVRKILKTCLTYSDP